VSWGAAGLLQQGPKLGGNSRVLELELSQHPTEELRFCKPDKHDMGILRFEEHFEKLFGELGRMFDGQLAQVAEFTREILVGCKGAQGAEEVVLVGRWKLREGGLETGDGLEGDVGHGDSGHKVVRVWAYRRWAYWRWVYRTKGTCG
jgi:hypothetical protein